MAVLSGYRVIELAGLGPCPMAGMILADMGAEVIRVERSLNRDPQYAKDVSARNKKSIVLNLKSLEGREALLRLVDKSDVLIEGFRPGVVERLAIGPEQCLARNPKLVFGRMTGWGQHGPLAQSAGHDINYIALSGVLHAIGRAGERPVVPLNVVGDFGGGAMLLVAGVLAALLEAKSSDRGQVVDAAMVDGSAQLMWMCHSFQAAGYWDATQRERNLLDGGAFFYDTYETLDKKFIALGPIESQFFSELVERVGLDKQRFNAATQNDQQLWPELKKELAAVIKRKTRDQWCELLEGTDVCFAPILSFEEAPQHPHNIERKTYINVDDCTQPAPAPRFSRTPSKVSHGQHAPGADTESILLNFGYAAEQIQAMKSQGVIS